MAAFDRRTASTTLSSRIISYLVRNGYSQADVARMLGVSQGYVSLVKSKERGLTLDHLERISQALSVSLGAFILAVTEPSTGKHANGGTRGVLAEAVKKADAVREAILRGAPAHSR